MRHPSTLTTRYSVRAAYHLVAFCCVLIGILGMGTSMFFLASDVSVNIAAGQAGFLAGAVLVGSGLIAIALLIRTGEERLASE